VPGRTPCGDRSKPLNFTTTSQPATRHRTPGTNNIHLLTPESTSFTSGIIINTTHLSKGLEFDEVIVPFVSATNYKTDIDKRMLYIACTRAMRKLTLTHTGEVSSFIKYGRPAARNASGTGLSLLALAEVQIKEGLRAWNLFSARFIKTSGLVEY